MLCGKFAELDTRNVTTLPMRDKLLECCSKRGDSWASEVQNRLIDLVAAEAIYHSKCYSRFFCLITSTVGVLGRPQDEGMLLLVPNFVPVA